MIRPIVEYGCALSENCSEGLCDLLDSIQFETAKIYAGTLRHSAHAKLLQELGWRIVSNRCKYFKLFLFGKMCKRLTPHLPFKIITSSLCWSFFTSFYLHTPSQM